MNVILVTDKLQLLHQFFIVEQTDYPLSNFYIKASCCNLSD